MQSSAILLTEHFIYESFIFFTKVYIINQLIIFIRFIIVAYSLTWGAKYLQCFLYGVELGDYYYPLLLRFKWCPVCQSQVIHSRYVCVDRIYFQGWTNWMDSSPGLWASLFSPIISQCVFFFRVVALYHFKLFELIVLKVILIEITCICN